MRNRVIVVLVLVAVVATGSASMNSGRIDTGTSRDSGQNGLQRRHDDPVLDDRSPVAADTQPDERGEAGTADCISLDDIDSHPVFAQDHARFDSFMAQGPAIDAFRGLSPGDVDAMARQGDTAALVVAGAMAEMRAANVDEGLAVSYLNFDARVERPKPPLNEHESRELERAAALYYEAALRGRFGALWRFADALDRLRGGAVGLDWISEAEFENLDSRSQVSLDPVLVFSMVAERLGAELLQGPHGVLHDKLYDSPTSERQAEVVSRLLDEFETARRRRGYPRPVVEPPYLSDPDAILDMLCDDVKSRMKLDD